MNQRLLGVGAALVVLLAIALWWLTQPDTGPALDGSAQRPTTLQPPASAPSAPPSPAVAAAGGAPGAPSPREVDQEVLRQGYDAPEAVGVDPVAITVWPTNREGVQGAVNEIKPLLQACYDAALERNPGLEGKIELGFTVSDVDGVGQVSAIDLNRDELAEEPMSQCVLGVMSVLQFDPPAGGTLDVTYPINFSPG